MIGIKTDPVKGCSVDVLHNYLKTAVISRDGKSKRIKLQRMNLNDATAFIAFENKNQLPQLWLDLGCGTGLFTGALAAHLREGSKIIAIDKDEKALRKIPAAVNDVIIQTKAADFVSDSLDVKGIDGILIANSLHYVKDKETLLKK